MGDGVKFICTRCRIDAPYTNYWTTPDNPMTQKLWGIIPVINASSMLFFANGGSWQRLIHGFKYRGEWRTARNAGRWFGEELKRGGLYNSVEVVVAVPLHPLKRLKRGYNQSEYIAEGIARSLGVPTLRRSVVRTVNNPSQTRNIRSERWSNVDGIFEVRQVEQLRGKHILLVDDVFTTGATICSCAESIIRSVPDCHISIATLACTRQG